MQRIHLFSIHVRMLDGKETQFYYFFMISILML
jgi:hypothetical protein